MASPGRLRRYQFGKTSGQVNVFNFVSIYGQGWLNEIHGRVTPHSACVAGQFILRT
jgi:hypothetical protein